MTHWGLSFSLAVLMIEQDVLRDSDRQVVGPENHVRLYLPPRCGASVINLLEQSFLETRYQIKERPLWITQIP